MYIMAGGLQSHGAARAPLATTEPTDVHLTHYRRSFAVPLLKMKLFALFLALLFAVVQVSARCGVVGFGGLWEVARRWRGLAPAY